MLTSLNRMVGLPVVWQDRQLGYVERVVPDAHARKLCGVVQVACEMALVTSGVRSVSRSLKRLR